jgi:hypothetical protein
LQEKKISTTFVPNLRENKLIDKLMKISVQDYNNTLALNKDKKYVTNEHTRYDLSYAIHVIGELKRFANTYTLSQNKIQTQLTPSAEDPRCARMTTIDIPVCYNTAEKTKITPVLTIDKDNVPTSEIPRSTLGMTDVLTMKMIEIPTSEIPRSQLGMTATARQTTSKMTTTTEEDPRQARMTNYGIPVCYSTAEKTKYAHVLTINYKNNFSSIEDDISSKEDDFSSIENDFSSNEDGISSVKDDFSAKEESVSLKEESIPLKEESISLKEKILSLKENGTKTPNGKMLIKTGQMLNYCKFVAPRCANFNQQHSTATHGHANFIKQQNNKITKIGI